MWTSSELRARGANVYTKDTYLTDPPACGCDVDDFFDSMAHHPDCFGYVGPSDSAAEGTTARRDRRWADEDHL